MVEGVAAAVLVAELAGSVASVAGALVLVVSLGGVDEVVSLGGGVAAGCAVSGP